MTQRGTGRRPPRAGIHLPRLTTAHSLQRCLLLVIELKVSPQLLQPGFSLSRLVFEDPLLGSCCGGQTAAVSAAHLVGGFVIRGNPRSAGRPEVDKPWAVAAHPLPEGRPAVTERDPELYAWATGPAGGGDLTHMSGEMAPEPTLRDGGRSAQRPQVRGWGVCTKPTHWTLEPGPHWARVRMPLAPRSGLPASSTERVQACGLGQLACGVLLQKPERTHADALSFPAMRPPLPAPPRPRGPHRCEDYTGWA